METYKEYQRTLGNCWALSWSLGEAQLYTLSARFSDFTVLFSRTGSLLGPLHSSSANYLKENRGCNGFEMLTSIKSGAPNENIVQNHLNKALLNVF